MGYISEVALVVRKEVYEEVLEEALMNPSETKYHMIVDEDGKSAILIRLVAYRTDHRKDFRKTLVFTA